jgi:predicted AAA+ superfamily ATPase
MGNQLRDSEPNNHLLLFEVRKSGKISSSKAIVMQGRKRHISRVIYATKSKLYIFMDIISLNLPKILR